MVILCLTGCSTGGTKGRQTDVKYQKEVQRISRYPDGLPANYHWIDYKQRALALNDLLFDESRSGEYFPLLWQDETYDTFGIAAYVGDGRRGQDGAQEAVTVIAAILSASQLGIDKRDENGTNYVKSLAAFYSEEEGIILNNPSGSSETTSMWYLIYPAILFTQVSQQYPQESKLHELALACIERWYQAYQVMKDTGSFDYTGFNFKTMQPYSNGVWKEPDCVAGIALLLYYGYCMTGNEEYRDAGIEALTFIEQYPGSPLYEALLYFAPSLAAMYNARYNTSFDIEGLLGDVFNGGSVPRGGWGSITGTWGGYPVDGLMGSTTDGGGYAFAMNTFTAAYALSPLAKYDTRYAASIGKWLLHVVSNARYFFADQSEEEKQSVSKNEKAKEFLEISGDVIPLEGIRKSYNSKTPWFGGDPTVYGWADTDFSLYSGAHLGMFAALVQATDVEGIIRVDLNCADFNPGDTINTYLLYNPYAEEKSVTYECKSKDSVDLYDCASGDYLATSVIKQQKIIIPKESAVVIAELPVGSMIEENGTVRYVNGKFLCAEAVSAGVVNYQNNDSVSGTFQVEVAVAGIKEEDAIETITVQVGEHNVTETEHSYVSFNAKQIGTGSKTFRFEVTMKSGLKDQFELRLNVK